jgi:hypothetical protein
MIRLGNGSVPTADNVGRLSAVHRTCWAEARLPIVQAALPSTPITKQPIAISQTGPVRASLGWGRHIFCSCWRRRWRFRHSRRPRAQRTGAVSPLADEIVYLSNKLGVTQGAARP